MTSARIDSHRTQYLIKTTLVYKNRSNSNPGKSTPWLIIVSAHQLLRWTWNWYGHSLVAAKITKNKKEGRFDISKNTKCSKFHIRKINQKIQKSQNYLFSSFVIRLKSWPNKHNIGGGEELGRNNHEKHDSNKHERGNRRRKVLKYMEQYRTVNFLTATHFVYTNKTHNYALSSRIKMLSSFDQSFSPFCLW